MRRSSTRLPRRPPRARKALPYHSGSGFKTRSAPFRKRSLPPSPPTGPVSTIIISTVSRSARHETLLCRYVLLDCPLQSERRLARTRAGLQSIGGAVPHLHHGRSAVGIPD